MLSYKYGTTREAETAGGPLTIVNVFFDAMPESYEIATSGQESHVYLMAIDVDVVTALEQFLQGEGLRSIAIYVLFAFRAESVLVRTV